MVAENNVGWSNARKTTEKVRRHFHKLWGNLGLCVCDVAAVNDVVHFLLTQDLVHLLKAGAVVFVILQILDVSISNVCNLQVSSRLETKIVDSHSGYETSANDGAFDEGLTVEHDYLLCL